MTDYIQLFEDLRLSKINDPDNTELHDSIRAEIFVFDASLTTTEKELFEYCNYDYISNNPSEELLFTSYVGEYISDSGDHS